MYGRRKNSQVHTVCACSVPPGFLGLKISVISVTLTSAKYADFSHIKKCLLLTALCVDNDKLRSDKGTQLFTVHAFVDSS